ncbi:hypothetical protein C8R46DRAFT_283213 [Mycena filopes]|nr:hypothetical protein C8R46DRAFT_283213 [Mycena filopes]
MDPNLSFFDEPEDEEVIRRRITAMLGLLQRSVSSGEQITTDSVIGLFNGAPGGLDQLATTFMSMELPQPEAIRYMEQVEQRGLEYLQRHHPNYFEPGGPDFWSLDETRPYMRVLGKLGLIHMQGKLWKKAAETVTQLLRLGPSDQLGFRLMLGGFLLRAGRPADALYFTQRWMEYIFGPPRGGVDFAPPFRNAMNEIKYRELATNPLLRLQMTYTAALAAFTLDGNSELARQYLHIAARYPIVLVKVIGRFEEQTSVDMHPVRPPNGVEDARDHLWLAQELWMKDDVWHWVSNDSVVRASIYRECSNHMCRKQEDRVGQWQKCSGCKSAWYCSHNCQKVHWSSHREVCKILEGFAIAYPKVQFPGP